MLKLWIQIAYTYILAENHSIGGDSPSVSIIYLLQACPLDGAIGPMGTNEYSILGVLVMPPWHMSSGMKKEYDLWSNFGVFALHFATISILVPKLLSLLLGPSLAAVGHFHWFTKSEVVSLA